MGAHPKITIDTFPKQEPETAIDGVGARVKVCFHYDSSRTIGGVFVRSDAEEPGKAIIKLDDDRYVLTTECMWSPDRSGSVAQN
jgi:hypothetical protein